jgi:hypothetical protein
VHEPAPRPRSTRRARRATQLLVVLAVVAVLGATGFGGDRGEVVVTTESCEPSFGGSWVWHGTLTNTSDVRHRYLIHVRYRRGARRDGKSGTTERAVPPGRTWNYGIQGELQVFGNPGRGEPKCKVTATPLPR